MRASFEALIIQLSGYHSKVPEAWNSLKINLILLIWCLTPGIFSQPISSFGKWRFVYFIHQGILRYTSHKKTSWWKDFLLSLLCMSYHFKNLWSLIINADSGNASSGKIRAEVSHRMIDHQFSLATMEEAKFWLLEIWQWSDPMHPN